MKKTTLSFKSQPQSLEYLGRRLQNFISVDDNIFLKIVTHTAQQKTNATEARNKEILHCQIMYLLR